MLQQPNICMFNSVFQELIYLNNLQELDIIKELYITILRKLVTSSRCCCVCGGRRRCWLRCVSRQLQIIRCALICITVYISQKSCYVDFLNIIQKLLQRQVLHVLINPKFILNITSFTDIVQEDYNNTSIKALEDQLFYIIEQGLLLRNITLSQVVYIGIEC